MKVQILQCDNKKWMPVGWLIKVIQRTSYSHYAIGFTSHSGNYMVLDATSKNVAIKTYESYLSHYKVVDEFTVTLPCTSLEEFTRWYENLLGISYGFMQLIGVLIKNKSLGKGIICNELVLRLLRRFTKYEDNNIDIRDLNYTAKIVEELADD